MKNILPWLRIAALVPIMAGLLVAQDPNPADDEPVSRAEYEQLLEKFEKLSAQFEALQKDASDASENAELARSLASLRSRVDWVEAGSDPGGSSRFLMTGFGHAGFISEEGENSTFQSQVNPLFLWELGDKVLFEAELELALNDNETDAELGFANISYLINDRMALSLGKFLTPLSHFSRDLHPSWINKLPDAPMYASHGGIVPMSSLGAQLSGAVPVAVDGSKIDYAVWVSNGPRLELEGDHAGSLEFDNFDDTNGNKAVGGRIGYSPTESLSFGAGAMASRVNESGTGTGSVNSLLSVVDFTYIRPVECLGGQIDVRGEHAWSDVSNPSAPYTDDTGTAIRKFNNSRRGGYLQAAFRPTESTSNLLRELEFITRFDYLEGPGRGGVVDRDRLTFGVDWWMSPNTVSKLAYRIENADKGKDSNALFLQWATGF